MRIGILTHHYVSNYGAFLQAWCLREAIAELFPEADVRVIDYINRKHMLINAGGFLRFARGRETPAAWLAKNRLPRVFARARKRDMRLTARVYSPEGLNALGLDAIVVGSDEVWNYADTKSYQPVKFGEGIAPGARLISYAASVGGVRAFEGAPEPAARGLKRFAALSARDDNTEAFVRAMTGAVPARVVDPVFLHATPDGATARVLALTEKPYILFYHCAPLPERAREAVRAFAAERGARILGAGEYDSLYAETSVDLAPFEWAEMFRRAQYVVTGTFHGAVFSIVNQRPFSVCPNNPTRAEKLRSLLGQFALAGRLSSAEDFDIRARAAEPIDYGPVNAAVARAKEASLAWLRGAIAGD